MAAKKSRSDRIDKLIERVDKLESRLARLGSAGAGKTRSSRRRGDPGRGFCDLPRVPEREFGPEVSPERASLIRVISKKWVNGTILHYHFLDDDGIAGDEAQHEVVREGFAAWAEQGIGIEFREVGSRNDAEIRIGFKDGDGAWSFVGRDCLEQGQNERTMNFGWNLAAAGEVDTAIHEIGHALGFPHEHQNPNAGIVWNEEAVYQALSGSPNFWSREKTHWNIIRKIAPDSVEGTPWDPDSVMHYPFGAGLIDQPAEYRSGLSPAPGLSEQDIAQVRFFYPGEGATLTELEPLVSVPLSLSPGEQRDFLVRPSTSRDYQLATFGQSDTVIVLFEDIDGDHVYMEGDDDGGTAFNARMTVRLVKGRRYVLRVRLYYDYSGGDTAVMLW